MLKTKEKRSQWHPACYAALQLEFADNKQELEFMQEIAVNLLPLKVDILIIKKDQRCEVKNEMGKIFRKYNLIEYKSPNDKLSYDTFLKGISYVYLYKVNEREKKKILIEEITLSFIRERKPEKLFKKLIEENFVIEEKFAGIYYIKKDGLFPIQIIVSKEMKHENHAWINSLTKRLNRKRAVVLIELTNKLVEFEDKQNADCVWEIVVTENKKLIEKMKEDDIMCKAMAEIFKPEIEAAAGVAFENGFNNGIDDKGIQVFKNMVARGFTREEAQSLAEISDELVKRALQE